MCGIALVVDGIRLDLSSFLFDSSSPSFKIEQLAFSEDDIKSALLRRGPDSLDTKKVYLKSKISSSVEEQELLSFFEGEEAAEKEEYNFHRDSACLSFANGETQKLENGISMHESVVEMHFIGATLQLRGVHPVSQPLVDSSRNVLLYNGEIFGGIHINNDSNDSEILIECLGKCCSCSVYRHRKACNCSEKGKNTVPDILSTIKGPWAVIYWQDTSRTLWFGRDGFGRRSLLVHWPTLEDPRFLLSSVSPSSFTVHGSGSDVENGIRSLNFWEELPCGIYSVSMDASSFKENWLGEVKKHEWTDIMLKELIEWGRVCVEPRPEEICLSSKTFPAQCGTHAACSGPNQALSSVAAQAVLVALRESVMRRSSLHRIFQVRKELAPVAVLFSGGLDSMILAALLDQCLDPDYEIDLLNVSFDRQSAPDRISAKAGIKELRRIAPLRRWKLIEIDADLSDLASETKHVMSLMNPANTYMDLNIGIALWLAARGDGWINEGIGDETSEDYQRIKYKSKARILLVGAGADEQCAGYGRHRTKYRNGSWLGLHEEMKLDMQRIWKRNLGRDDRIISDNGKEARFPFLDEDVIKTLLSVPLWEIADLNQPSGKGDKKILREVAKLLGLHEVAVLPKRAIQFGSRIARESNRKNFGSNRAANQASAGSTVINVLSDSTS